ncbi:MAG: hypothetical protein VKN60_12300 [Cyanobacteriota bacterium]|nr:hypothetical protein [Cyanobacteriota bacterium]
MLETQTHDLKPLVREVLQELLIQDRETLLIQDRETLRDLIYEVMEDIALARAIEEGLDDENVSREEVFALLAE